MSHAPSQQAGSTEQTALQQEESRQPGVPLTAKQSPTPGQESAPTQTAVAISTQRESQSEEQQLGSTLQTAREQSAFAQPLEACGVRQPSRPMVTTKPTGWQTKPASRAQTASQRTSQQKGSIVLQILVQQVLSLQPGL